MSAYSDLVSGHASLRLYLRLGESAGTTADDIGPNNLDGTYAGTGITYSVAGAIANDASTAVTFDGTSSSPLTVPDNNALDLTDGPFSLEFWVKRSTTLGTRQVLLNKGTGAYQVQFAASNVLQFSKSDNTVIAATAAIVDQTWHHIVVTKNGSSYAIYVDGASAVATDTGNQTLGDTANVLRVAHQGATTQRYVGSLDEIAVYGAVLSPTEVLDHYNAGIGRIPVTGTTAGTSTTSGDVVLTRGLDATTAGTSTTSGSLDVAHSLSGTTAGTSTTSGDLSATFALTGTSTGASTTAGSVGITYGLTGTSDGTASTVGAIVLSLALAGTTTGTATTVGDLVLAHIYVDSASGNIAFSASRQDQYIFTSAASGSVSVTGEATTEQVFVSEMSGDVPISGGRIVIYIDAANSILSITGSAESSLAVSERWLASSESKWSADSDARWDASSDDRWQIHLNEV